MQKNSNSIIIGGPIAVGKSTLVEMLPFSSIQELDENDELSKLLLEKMYKGDQISTQVFQLDLMLNRFDKYKRYANKKNMHVFDRFIIEDYFFAKKLLSKYPNVWEYYFSIWNDKMKEIISKIGVPKHYVLLSCDWNTFKQRLFKRKRIPEIKNFEKNKKYFKNLIEEYIPTIKKLLKKYKISFSIIDTQELTEEEVLKKTINILKRKGIINEE